MKLTTTAVREALQKAHFTSVEEVRPEVLLFHRQRTGLGEPYALCYLDYSNVLPSSKELLKQYQEEVIAQRYFASQTSSSGILTCILYQARKCWQALMVGMLKP